MCTHQSEHVLGQPPRKTTQPHPRKQTQRVHLRFMHTERHYDQRSSRWSRAEQAKHPPTAERKGIGLSAHLNTPQNERMDTAAAQEPPGRAADKTEQKPEYTLRDNIHLKFKTSGTHLW